MGDVSNIVISIYDPVCICICMSVYVCRCFFLPRLNRLFGGVCFYIYSISNVSLSHNKDDPDEWIQRNKLIISNAIIVQ